MLTTSVRRGSRSVPGVSRHIAATVTAALAALFLSAPMAGARQAPAPAAPASQPAPPPSTAQTLPGGASQMQETHGDWRVVCAQPNGQKVCAFSTQLSDKDSRQLVIGVELRTSATDKAEGTLIMPFGLAVSKPVTLQVDDTGATMPMSFSTCAPIGCLVTLSFDAATVGALKKGTTLIVKATAAESGQEASFKIPLRGFSSALDRTAALSK